MVKITSKWQKTSKLVGVKSPRIPKILIMNPTMLYAHNFHIQALIEEFSTKKLWPLKGPFQGSFDHKFLSHNFKWHMWTHFSYICFKTFPMVYWGPNLDHIYYVHFCFKNTRPPMELQFPKCFSLKCVWIPKQFSLASIFMC